MYNCIHDVSLYYPLFQISNLLLSIEQNVILLVVFFKHISEKDTCLLQSINDIPVKYYISIRGIHQFTQYLPNIAGPLDRCVVIFHPYATGGLV